MFLQQNLHFPKFSSGVFVRAVGKICAPVGKLLFRHCGGPVLGGPGGGGYLVDLPSRYETRLPRWGDGKLAVGSPRRLGGDRWSVLVPGQNPAARYGSLEPIDAVDPVVKARAGSGSNAASGNGDGQMRLAGVWPRRRDRFVSR